MWSVDLASEKNWGWFIAGIFTFLAVVWSLYLIYKHLLNYNYPRLQRPIVRILLMVPIYAVDSWISMRWIDASLYIDIIRDCYEAYVIYQFFHLLIVFINVSHDEECNAATDVEVEDGFYLDEPTSARSSSTLGDDFAFGGDEEGGFGSRRSHREVIRAHKQARRERAKRVEYEMSVERHNRRVRMQGSGVPMAALPAGLKGEDRVVALLETKPLQHHPFPLKCVTFTPDRAWLKHTKRCILQFTVMKPLLAILTIVLEVFGRYGGEEGNWSPAYGYIWILVIENVSISLAMYYLVVFYHVAAKELAPFKPVPKFLCIKMVVMFAFWQGVIVSLLTYIGVFHTEIPGFTDKEVQTGFQDFLICIEMFFIALAHSYAFGYATFRKGKSPWFAWIPCADFLCCLFCCCHCCEPCRNFGHVAQQGDMVRETIDTFDVYQMPGRIVGGATGAASRLFEVAGSVLFNVRDDAIEARHANASRGAPQSTFGDVTIESVAVEDEDMVVQKQSGGGTDVVMDVM